MVILTLRSEKYKWEEAEKGMEGWWMTNIFDTTSHMKQCQAFAVAICSAQEAVGSCSIVVI